MKKKSIISKYLAEIGKRGGSAASTAKRKAARANGKRGGRPRKADSSRAD